MVHPVCRLCFREEGQYVNCYVAEVGTMEGAYLLGTLHLGAAKKGHFERFKASMYAIMADMMADLFPGRTHGVTEVDAPAHERTYQA